MSEEERVVIVVCVTIIALAAILAGGVLVNASLRSDSAAITIMAEYTRVINVPPDVICEITEADTHTYVVRCSP